MALSQERPLLVPVTSPFLKHPSMNVREAGVDLSEYGVRRRSMECVELIPLNEEATSVRIRTLNDEQSTHTNNLTKKQNRLSREIIGLNDPYISAPDNAVSNSRDKENEATNFADSYNSLVRKSGSDDDTSSVLFGGSVTSTIPDRYGFTGGAQYTQDKDSIPINVLRRRELKWLQMIDEWNKYMKYKYKKVRSRCRKGIPSSVRCRAWQYLCGGIDLLKKNPGVFDELVSQPGEPRWIEDIRKDLHRQFPFHEMFAEPNSHGQEELFRVLKAYSVLNPEEGYFQAQAPVAAMLVMHMPAEQAFWCLVAICENYLPGYYSQGLEAIQIDGDMLVTLLKRVSPSVHRHLSKQNLDPLLYMMEWFLCIYTRTLPWSSVLRVWDMFFCEGVKVLFRVGLVLLKYSFRKPGLLKQCPTMYETMEVLRNLDQSITDENFLISHMLNLPFDERDLEKIHDQVVTRREKQKNAQ